MRECEAASEEPGTKIENLSFVGFIALKKHTHTHKSTSEIYEAAARDDFRQRPWREVKNNTKEERR